MTDDDSDTASTQRAGYFAGPLRRVTAKADPGGVTARAAERGSAALGKFLREQRQLAQLSLREMARLTQVSNAYLSQVERGLHEPSVRVLTALADALGVPVEDLVSRVNPSAASAVAPNGSVGVEAAVRADPVLTASQKEALLSVYRSYLAAALPTAAAAPDTPAAPDSPAVSDTSTASER